MGFWTKPVFLAGVVGIGVPVAAAAVVASLTIRPDEPSPVAAPRTTTAAPTAATTAPSSAIMANPVGFQPDSIYFSTAEEGWVTGRTLPCAGTACVAVQHTTDGGHTWQPVDNPAALLGGTDAGRTILYSDGPNRWVATDQHLFATHDDGATWHDATPPDLGPKHWSVAAGDNTIRAVDVLDGQVRLRTTPVDDESWSQTNIPADTGTGPVATGNLQVQGNRAWVVVYNRGATGARLTDGSWKDWKLPCGGNGPADWHASSPNRMIVLCGRPGPSGDDASTLRLLTSTDGGADFTETAQLSPAIPHSSVLIPDDSTHIVVGIDNQLLVSGDGGDTWTTAYTAPEPGWEVRSGRFVSAADGFAVLGREPGTPATQLLATHDAGRTWTPLTFG